MLLRNLNPCEVYAMKELRSTKSPQAQKNGLVKSKIKAILEAKKEENKKYQQMILQDEEISHIMLKRLFLSKHIWCRWHMSPNQSRHTEIPFINTIRQSIRAQLPQMGAEFKNSSSSTSGGARILSKGASKFPSNSCKISGQTKISSGKVHTYNNFSYDETHIAQINTNYSTICRPFK
ncbi:hypothetical protein H5410_002523 [Solanum commersonii]|uniref:Uncharacterized protein n=1 Tax=Solanum commersonii TaxID=4109 RepID=A0A9J6B259_SOLCO|nr:hypothetical protein H5410_002523 [Solanum commersonii]